MVCGSPVVRAPTTVWVACAAELGFTTTSAVVPTIWLLIGRPLTRRQGVPFRVGVFDALQPTGVLDVVLSGKAVVHHIVLARSDAAMDRGPTWATDRDVVIEGVRREEASSNQPVEVGRDRHLQGIRPNPIDADHQHHGRGLAAQREGEQPTPQGRTRKGGKDKWLHPCTRYDPSLLAQNQAAAKANSTAA